MARIKHKSRKIFVVGTFKGFECDEPYKVECLCKCIGVNLLGYFYSYKDALNCITINKLDFRDKYGFIETLLPGENPVAVSKDWFLYDEQLGYISVSAKGLPVHLTYDSFYEPFTFRKD